MVGLSRGMLLAGLALVLHGSPWAQEPPAPEATSGRAERAAVEVERFMIATANGRATEAGAAVLRRGGGAVDAMVAAQMVLNVVEPQSSGSAAAASRSTGTPALAQLASFDGRETAPAAATPGPGLDAEGKPRWILGRGRRRPLGRRARHAGSSGGGAPPATAACPGASSSAPRSNWPRTALRSLPRLAARDCRGGGRRLADFPRRPRPLPPGDGSPSAGETCPTRTSPGRCASSPPKAASRSTAAPSPRDIVAAVAAEDQPRPHDASTTSPPTRSASGSRSACPTAPSRSAAWGRRPPAALTVGQTLGILSHFDLPALGPGCRPPTSPRGQQARLRRPQPLHGRRRLRRDARRACSTPPTSPSRAALIRPRPRAMEAAPGEPPWRRGRAPRPGERPAE